MSSAAGQRRCGCRSVRGESRAWSRGFSYAGAQRRKIPRAAEAIPTPWHIGGHSHGLQRHIPRAAEAIPTPGPAAEVNPTGSRGLFHAGAQRRSFPRSPEAYPTVSGGDSHAKRQKEANPTRGVYRFPGQTWCKLFRGVGFASGVFKEHPGGHSYGLQRHIPRAAEAIPTPWHPGGHSHGLQRHIPRSAEVIPTPGHSGGHSHGPKRQIPRAAGGFSTPGPAAEAIPTPTNSGDISHGIQRQ